MHYLYFFIINTFCLRNKLSKGGAYMEWTDLKLSMSYMNRRVIKAESMLHAAQQTRDTEPIMILF